MIVTKGFHKAALEVKDARIRQLEVELRAACMKVFSTVSYEGHSAMLASRNRVIHELKDRVEQLEKHNKRLRTACDAFYLGDKAPMDAVVHAGSPLTYKELRKYSDAQREVGHDLLKERNRVRQSNVGLIREVEGLKKALREAKAANRLVVGEVGYECTYRHTCQFKKEVM